MSKISPNETSRTWHPNKLEHGVGLYLSGLSGEAAGLVGAAVGGFPVHVAVAPVNDPIDEEALAQMAAAVIQVDPDAPASIRRFERLAAAVDIPLIAVAYDPPLALVRTLLRAGARDVLPLPLSRDDLESSLATIGEEIQAYGHAGSQHAKLVTVLKGLGGIGATALVSQLALRFAQHEARFGRETCLIDLDMQFGDVAFQLGLRPRLSILDLLEAGGRLDADLLRATTTPHSSGLKVIAAPPDMLPLEGVSSDGLLQIVNFATRELGTVFLDLPSNWTNWSLSLLARSDIVLLVTELSIAGLNRAKRQLDMLQSQDLGGLDVRVVANRFEKAQGRTIRPNDVRQALGRDVAFTVVNDPSLMRTAIDRGVAIGELKRKSAVGSDLDRMDAGVAAALGLER